jgi:hypothetical protein
MDFTTICVLISSISFFAYAFSYFKSEQLKNEFKRFGLEKLGLFTIILEFAGATGLLVGFLYNPILTLSSFGLSLLMLIALLVRIKLKDSIWVSFPALFYLLLNLFICWQSLKLGHLKREVNHNLQLPHQAREICYRK